jgi:hypothetical protein
LIRWVNVVGTPFCSAHQSLSPPNSPKKKGEILDRKGLQQLCVCVCVCVCNWVGTPFGSAHESSSSSVPRNGVGTASQLLASGGGKEGKREKERETCSSKRRWNCESAACLRQSCTRRIILRSKKTYRLAKETYYTRKRDLYLYKAHHFEILRHDLEIGVQPHALP